MLTTALVFFPGLPVFISFIIQIKPATLLWVRGETSVQMAVLTPQRRTASLPIDIKKTASHPVLNTYIFPVSGFFWFQQTFTAIKLAFWEGSK
jgi:hypothetical protein